MTLSGNSTLLRVAVVVDFLLPSQMFKSNCRKWVIHFCISQGSSMTPSIPSSKLLAYPAQQNLINNSRVFKRASLPACISLT